MGILSRIFHSSTKQQTDSPPLTGYKPPQPSSHPPTPSDPQQPTTSPPLTNADKFTFLQHLSQNNRHTGRTFYSHLFGVYTYLAEHHLPQPVCDAGLYHSIYGTEFYSFQNKEGTRDVITGIIGSYAETLVWVFCRARPRFGSIINGETTEGGGGRVTIGREMQRDLCWIEIANLGDQNRDGRYDGKLEKLREVIGEIDTELGNEPVGELGKEGTDETGKS